jgi:hypothetical protein
MGMVNKASPFFQDLVEVGYYGNLFVWILGVVG